MGANAIKLGLYDKSPAYCWDLNVGEWYNVKENNDIIYQAFFRLKTKKQKQKKRARERWGERSFKVQNP